MNERKRKTKDPCERCGLGRIRCLCGLIPSITLKMRLTLLIHAKELKRTTNTGRLAVEALTNSEMIVRGASGTLASDGSRRAEPLDLSSTLLPGFHPLLLFPGDDAIDLNSDFAESLGMPIQLLVPDGNWRQASKVHSRHRELGAVTRVKISSPNLAEKHLRAEHLPDGMSTLEAIARAIGVIESRDAESQLLMLYREKLHRTLEGRGVESISSDR